MLLAFKHALRQLAKSAQFSILSILLLALGIALSTTAFTIANNALLKPLPFPHPEQLVRVFASSRDESALSLTPGDALQLCDELTDIGEFGLFTLRRRNVAEPGQPPEAQFGMHVSVNALHILGVEPRLGRGFMPDEGEPGHSYLVLLTQRYWRDHFGGNEQVLGKTLRIETDNHTVLGVLPPNFDEPLLWWDAKFVTSMIIWPDWRNSRTEKWMDVMGRLKPGVSLRQAQVRLDALAAKLAQDHPVEFGKDRLYIVPLGSSYAGDGDRMVYWLIVGLSLFVLVIACANLGGVQLARTLSRRGELAVRVALGANRTHLIGVLGTESILVAMAGCSLGVLVSYWLRFGVANSIRRGGPPLEMDSRVIGFAIVAGLLAVAFFGLVPAWFATRQMSSPVLKETSRGSTSGPSHARLKFALIVGQLGLALVLISSAASVVFGVRAYVNRDRGWRPANVIVAALSIPWASEQKEVASHTLTRQLEEKLGALPGVGNVGIAAAAPVYGDTSTMPFLMEGADIPAPGAEPITSVYPVNRGFFETLKISLLQGRLFSVEWKPTDAPVAVISASTARYFWPNQTALGKRVRFERDGTWHEIIGIVSDASFQTEFEKSPTPFQAYRPVQERPSTFYNIVLQSPVNAATLERSIRTEIAAIDPDFMIRGIANLPQRLEQFASNGPLVTSLVVFAVAGVVIAMVGLYGVMSQLTQQRRREIGIRMALGAPQRQVLAMMLGQGGKLLGLAALCGLAASFAVNAIFRKAMPELPELGLVGQLIITALLVGAGLCACYFPARRAAAVNPIEVLRSE